MAQIVNEEVSVSNFREVEIEDLLGREPVKTNLDEVMGYIAGKVVLVTGGGGSIGSELCRQIAAHHPAQLIIFDIYENTTYDLQQELKKNFPKLNLVVLIGSVRKTNYVAVRFGNVLGSNGSVIPLFKKQIAEGGPVTVTDKNIIRYFMTIPEAVSLVLQAGAYAKGGEIFVLDMGEPVKIDDMARNLIKLSGYEPDVDIPIVYTGLRPGEKMFEECLKEEEGLQKTENDLIFIGKPIEFDQEEFFEHLKDLKKTAYEDDPQMKVVVKRLVPSYQLEKS